MGFQVRCQEEGIQPGKREHEVGVPKPAVLTAAENDAQKARNQLVNGAAYKRLAGLHQGSFTW